MDDDPEYEEDRKTLLYYVKAHIKTNYFHLQVAGPDEDDSLLATVELCMTGLGFTAYGAFSVISLAKENEMSFSPGWKLRLTDRMDRAIVTLVIRRFKILCSLDRKNLALCNLPSFRGEREDGGLTAAPDSTTESLIDVV